MFVVKDLDFFEWPVTVEVPRGGKHETHRFTARFRMLPSARLTEIIRDGSDAELARETVVGWSELGRDDGNGPEPIAFSAEELDALLEYPFFQRAFATAYIAAMSGGGLAAKN